MQIKIAKQNYYAEKRERKRYNNSNFIYFTILVVVIGSLQFYKFLIISRTEHGVRCKSSCLKISITISNLLT